jgi:lysozyme
MMKTSDAGIKRIIEREGCKLKAYRDSGGVWTICVGHTSRAGPPVVTPGMVCTLTECRAILANDLKKFEVTVNAAIKVPMTQNQFDAMVSLCFNIGGYGFKNSSVVRRFNAGDIAGAADAFLLWNKVKGRVVQGLVNRRRRERNQFLGR